MFKSHFYCVTKTRTFLLSTLSKISVFLLALSLSACSDVHEGFFFPAGPVAADERKLFFDSVALMLIVVLPVIIMSFAFAYRYRASNVKKEDYKPNWSHSYLLETIWWTVPTVIVIILGVITWKKSHELDPYQPLAVKGKPLLIEAVALRWKWLFIYPEQNIATVNYVQIPKNRQVEFWITADAPMSAFFIPRLGSQIYAMAGMRTRLHLLAEKTGVYEGLNTQYNGEGFSEMHFKVHVGTDAAFHDWVHNVKTGPNALTLHNYASLTKPTIAVPVSYYSSVHPHLFKRIMDQYMMPNMTIHA